MGIRVAPDPLVRDPLAPVYYLDLNNEKGQAVRISAAGWSIVDDPPVKFRRPKGMGRLPIPEPGGSLEILREFVNIEDDDWILFIAGLTHDFLPVTPQPIKVMAGEQGSCKSTTTEVMKRCVDPYRPMLGSPPADIRDLVIIANNTWIVAFDNLSTIRPWLSDAICRLAYGTGFQTRTLCTNDELTSFESCRPIIVNGIDDLVTRHDLLSRALVLNCPTLDEDNSRADDEFWLAFETAHPRILEALLDAIVGGLATLPALGKIKLPRMASVCAVGRGSLTASRIGTRQVPDRVPWQSAIRLGRAAGRFATCFGAHVPGIGDPILGRKLPATSHGARVCTSAAIRAHAKWPRGSRSLSCALAACARLAKQGIDVQFAPRLDRSRLIRVVWSSTMRPPL